MLLISFDVSQVDHILTIKLCLTVLTKVFPSQTLFNGATISFVIDINGLLLRVSFPRGSCPNMTLDVPQGSTLVEITVYAPLQHDDYKKEQWK